MTKFDDVFVKWTLILGSAYFIIRFIPSIVEAISK